MVDLLLGGNFLGLWVYVGSWSYFLWFKFLWYLMYDHGVCYGGLKQEPGCNVMVFMLI